MYRGHFGGTMADDHSANGAKPARGPELFCRTGNGLCAAIGNGYVVSAAKKAAGIWNGKTAPFFSVFAGIIKYEQYKEFFKIDW